MVYLIIAGLPCLALILSLFCRFCCGPFWLGINSDPSYLYLMNSLYLADHQMPTFIEHPGITLQALGALVIRILSFPRTGQALVEETLKRPEFFLYGIYAVVIFFYITTLVILGWYVWAQTKNSTLVFLAQSPFFLYLTMYKVPGDFLPIPANVCAETLLTGFLNLYTLCLLHVFFKDKAAPFTRTAMGWGVTCGLMMATKIISIPLLLMPVIVLKNFKARLIFGLAMILSLLAATIPIWPECSKIFGWWGLLTTHQNFVGNGPVGFINWHNFGHALMSICRAQWLLAASAVFAVGFVVVRCMGGGSDGKKACLYTVLAAGTIVLQFLMVGKEPRPHYLVPAIGLFGVLWFFVYQSGLNNFWFWRGGIIIFTLCSTFLGFVYMRNFYIDSRERMEFSGQIYSRFDQCVICGYYRSSSIPFALVFSDDNAGRKAYGDIIQKLYSQHYFMAILEKRFDDSKGIVFAEDLLMKSPCLLLYGEAGEFAHYNSPLMTVQSIKKQGDEELYRVLTAHDKEARQLFNLAQLALVQGQGQAAYALGSRADALGLPAAHDFVIQMNEIIAKSEAK